LALLSLSCSNAQNVDPATGLNITGNVLNLGGGLPWSGTVTGAAGGESGGPTPAYNPSTGNIIFSYASRTVSQVAAINAALFNAGTGIQIGGYRYSWDINNDQNNFSGNRGTLTGNVSLVGANGSLLESFNYDYTKLNSAGFTRFSASQLFENRYSLASISNLTVSFTGISQNWWAGYYGPRVHVNEFSLLYTAEALPPPVDPCVSNPLSSTKCPGYGAAFVAKSNTNSSTTSTPTASAIVTNATSDTTTSTPIVNAGGVQLSSTGTVSAPDNIPQTVKDVQATTQQSLSSTALAASNASNQPSNKSAPNMSLIMSTISRIQANDRAAQTSAVQNANRAMAASSAAAQEQAMAVAESSNSANSASAQITQQISQTAMLAQPVISSSITSQDRGTGSSQFSLVATSAGRSESADGSTGLGLTTAKSISMNDLVSARMNIDTDTKNTTADTVNRNVQPNELAGRVDIASIATQPKGFDVYATLIIKDADFYAPKDIYGNQRTIDNARALRLLSSDRLHQEMIDLQYRR